MMTKSVTPSLLLGLIALFPLQAQQARTGSDLNLPPPATDGATTRVRIPIPTARSAVEMDRIGDVTEEDALAFSIAAEAQGWVPADSTGILKPGMSVLVTVRVQGRVEFAQEPQRINQSGKIGLPLVQIIEIGNKDIEDAEALITRAYKKYYRDPLVNVEFAGMADDPSQSPWGYVTLMGNVNSPGPLAMPATRILTVTGAVKRAGGSDASANKGSIRIYRPIPEEDSVEMIKVDLEVLGKRGRHGEDVRLQAGDVVYIPERIF